jgi:lysozyme
MTKQIFRLSRKGLNFIKGWEGFIPYLYDDLVPARIINGKRTYVEWKGGKLIGTLTIGYGHTSAARGKFPMTVGTRITEAQATQLLDDDLDPVEEYVNKVVRVPITQGQFDALVSITFNMGEGNLRKSALLARLNAGDYRGARNAFDLYVNSKGRRLQGLVNRRNAEQLLWDTVDPAQAKAKTITLQPTEYSSTTNKPAVPDTPKEIDQPAAPRASTTVEGGGGIATGTIGTGGMVEQGVSSFDKASEYAEKAASAKYTAESLGVEPLTIASAIGPKAYAFFALLFTSPTFWISFALFLIGVAIYLARRWKSWQEVVPGAYEVAGTPLPTLIASDTVYAGIDTSDDVDAGYYTQDPVFEGEEDDPGVVDIDPPARKKPAKRKASKRKK